MKTRSWILSFLAIGSIECYGPAPWQLSAQAQPGSGQIQPYQPSVVGGLPPNSRGLEQPVYLADRSEPRALYSDLPDPLNASQLIDSPNLQSPNQTPSLDLSKFHAGELIAVVGREPILIGDLVDPKRVTTERVQSPGFEIQLRKALAEVVVRKALAQRFIAEQVSGKPIKEREEGERQIRTKVTQAFYDSVLPNLMKRQKCETEEEFYKKLAASQMTMQSLQRDYAENMLASQCLRGHITEKPTVDLAELSDYYESHVEDYQKPARVRFQILTAMFSKYPNKNAAFQAIGEMGNEVFFGSPFDVVAKQKSSGYTAAQGGLFDWTSQGALKSKAIDEQVFSIPMNKLSEIFEDADGYHIVRVLERNDAYIQPFTEVQPEIRKKLIEAKKKKEEKDFTQKVRSETPIWTRWPEDMPGSMPISQLLN